MNYSELDVKVGVLYALVEAGAEVTLSQDQYGGRIKTVNGCLPRWEIRMERVLGQRTMRVSHVNVGRGRIGITQKCMRPKDGVLNFKAIAQAIIADVDRQLAESEAREKGEREYQARMAKEKQYARIAARIVIENGGRVDRINGHIDDSGEPYSNQKTVHCRLTAVSWGLKIETATENEDDARAIVAAIEGVMRRRREEAGAA